MNLETTEETKRVDAQTAVDRIQQAFGKEKNSQNRRKQQLAKRQHEEPTETMFQTFKGLATRVNTKSVSY